MSAKSEPDSSAELDGACRNEALTRRYLELQQLRRRVRIAECGRASPADELEVIDERRAAASPDPADSVDLIR